MKDFTILRVIEHGGPELTGQKNTYETIYEIKSHPSGEIFLISMGVLCLSFHPGDTHPKEIMRKGESIRIELELEAKLRKKYLDDYGINSFIVGMIAYGAGWNCDDPVPKK